MSKHIVIDNRIRRASTGTYSDRLVDHLQAIDTDNHFTILIQSSDTWRPTVPNFEVQFCDYEQFSLNPMEQIGFARQLNKLNADLVHFPMNQQPLLYFGNVVTTTLDLTMLSFTRAGKTPLPIFWIKMLGYRFLFWYSNKRSKEIITISNYVKGALAKRYPFTADKTYTTYCASEPPIKLPSAQPYGVRAPFILYVGTAFPHKNLERLIKAFEIVHAKHPDLNLILAGKREYYYEQLQEFAEKSPAHTNIIFTGFVSDIELKWLYERAQAYVFPSLSEGFGLPGLEAMAHGVPVVSSNATCLPEVYRNAAVYFDPLKPAEMAEKIELVLTDLNFRSDLVAKGGEVLKQYSWRKMAEETLAVYKKALDIK